MEGAWREHAACLGMDTEIFFPEGTPPKEAKLICSDCMVRPECLEFALDFSCTGVWGGTTKAERARILRQRNEALAP